MVTNGYDFITYDENLFRLRFETSLDCLTADEQFEHGLETISTIIDSFASLLLPSEIEVAILEVEGDCSNTITLSNNDSWRSGSITDSIKEAADSTAMPRLGRVAFKGSIRVTLSNGVHYLGGHGELSEVERRVTPSSDVSTPLEIHIAQNNVMRPTQTEIVSVYGNSDHWLDGDEEKFHLPEAPPLAKLDQTRLAAALSNLYDAIDPDEIVFDTFENAEGWNTPKQTVPGLQDLTVRHAVEWVLEHFEQRCPDDTSLELEYSGDEVHPLVTNPRGSTPDEKVQLFLGKAIPDERYAEGATAFVQYPDDSAVFVKTDQNWWSIEDGSELSSIQ
jgi:hypothetical protein